MCRIYNFLGERGHSPSSNMDTDNAKDVIGQTQDIAAHHNTGYTVLEHLKRLVSNVSLNKIIMYCSQLTDFSGPNIIVK